MSTPIRVLVIEDSEDDMLLQLRELRRGGYEPMYQRVQTADDLRAALKNDSWDLVLSDFALPGFNGLDALRVVQSSGIDVPFILISGTVGEETAVESMKAGAHDYLLKGNLTRLAPAVRRELGEAVERRQRRQAESALRESRSLLALIYDHTTEMLLLLARSDEAAGYRVASVNRAWLDFAARLGLPWSEQDCLGRPLDEVMAALTPAPERQALTEHVRFASSSGRRVGFEQQWRLGGETIFTEQHLIPVVGQGQARHLLWASRDVTERKRAEDQQRRLEAQLAHSQKLETLGTMASGIAHDFNNILAGISGYLEIVRADTRELPETRECVQQIEVGVHRATDLARRILAFSRKRTAVRKPIHLGPIIHEVLAFLRPLVPAGVVVQANAPPEGPMVIADAGQMHQVLMNLCTNAVQSMQERPGTLSVSLEAVSVSPEFAKAHAPLRPGEHVLLTVSDTGRGMDESVLARLFEPFFTTRAESGGAGLGLAVVHSIVKNHQGALVVSSTVGQGTSFRLYFPVADESPGRGFSNPGVRLGHGEHILFVDDEEYLTQMGAALLGRLGYRASVFTDPQKALAAFLAEPGDYDVLVTDLTMPGMKGTDLANQMRQARPDLPVILTTGYGGLHDLERARTLGFQRVLEKPFTVEKLSNLLGQALWREGST
jgi:signal transduction histidine kinase/DNA-binding response OmpR family regulator